MEKKFLIPIILGSALLLGIVFTLVYKKTSEDPFKEPEVSTLAPKETESQIETKVQTDNFNNVEEFNVNETQIQGADISELIDNDIELDGNYTQNGISANVETLSDSETLSDEEVNRLIEEKLDTFTDRPYDSSLDAEEFDENAEYPDVPIEEDLSKYRMNLDLVGN